MTEPKPSAFDAQCLFEAELEKLRREYNLTSQRAMIAARAKALVESYFISRTMCESVLARFYLPH
jgi:hypothetical protein